MAPPSSCRRNLATGVGPELSMDRWSHWLAHISRIFLHPPAIVVLLTSDVAHYSKKRSTTWVGYKVHLTEMCEPHLPLLPRACGNHIGSRL